MFSKTEYAYDILRHGILDGAFKPGERLRLSRIAKDLHLSEMPVREALRLLQRDGLVNIHLHRGAEVAQLSFEHAWDIEEVRLQLEARACLLAAAFHDEASCARLGSFLTEMEAVPNDPVSLARINRAFHTELMLLTPNAFMREHVQDLWDRAWQFSSASFFEFMPRRMAKLAIEGRTMLDCVLTKDFDRLEDFLQSRIRDVTAAWKEAADAYAMRAAHALTT
jgi:DNA-binding GntR family transcriptional regulator